MLLLLSKPEAIEIIVKSLDESKLMYGFIKLRITNFLYFVKYASRTDLDYVFRSVSGDSTQKISEDIQFYVNNKLLISSLDNASLEEWAHQATKQSLLTIARDKRDFLTRLFVMLAASK